MDTISINAYAKININLAITGKRADGYHLLSSVMHTIDICDRIFIKKSDVGIKINAIGKNIPLGSDNTMWKAAKLMMDKFALDGGIDITIEKNIPVCAGLGGPSADAAAVIKGVDRLFDLNLSFDEMRETGSRIGADVPFLIEGGCALCEGIGDILTPLPDRDLKLLVIKPNVSVSTQWAYEQFDSIKTKSQVFDIDNVQNDFELVVFPEYPVIKAIKNALIENGANAALMSGSGASVFGIFQSDTVMEDCRRTITEKFPDAEIIPSTTVGRMGECII